MRQENESRVQSPEVAKISTASAISLGLVRGRMYRGAVNRCVNLLAHHPEGCAANCAYCGLARRRPGSYSEKSFIHVAWPVFSMDEIIDAINQAPAYLQRTCISMITNGKCRAATIAMTQGLARETPLPISVLLSPTILKKGDLQAIKDAGADKVGIAVDLATEELFDRYRGAGVHGPHTWGGYWDCIENSLKIFGSLDVGAHLMVGMGETEKEMTAMMDRLWKMGVASHLFSFFAEENSALSDRPQPDWPVYLRVQTARYLIEEDLSTYDKMAFDELGRICDFGCNEETLRNVIESGEPFMTTGCLGPGGRVACNRPFGNCLPGEKQWNYPYPPNEREMGLIREAFEKVT
ncbi:MAG TPA: radical SAM protein [Desulfobacteraceae bacterium]|nr:radical SAM protein [Desulfobacteraceae bacterium]